MEGIDGQEGTTTTTTTAAAVTTSLNNVGDD
jgi:hypothetical protein